MSSEEDSQLKDLVAQTLESKGVLSKLRAEIRANVFLALEANEKFKEQIKKNEVIANLLKTEEGVLALCIVQEFLEFCNLKFTKTVLDSEVGSHTKSKSHQQLVSDLKLECNNSEVPVLCQLLETSMTNSSQVGHNKITFPSRTAQSKNLLNGDHDTQKLKQTIGENKHHLEDQLVLNFNNPYESQEETHRTNKSDSFPNLILKTVDELPSLTKPKVKTILDLEPKCPSHEKKLDDGDTGSVSEIEEDLDSTSDLLNSSGSARGDITQDNSISTLSSGIGDFYEDVNKV